MFRIAKYLKPFIVLILIAIALLFVQAMADLSPPYMSEIVNVGIQQGGITDAVHCCYVAEQMEKFKYLWARIVRIWHLRVTSYN